MCIHENFESETRIAEMPQIVTAKCGFPESTMSNDVLMNSQQLKACDSMKDELKLLKSDNLVCKSNLESKSAEILRFEKQASMMKEVYDKLEAQLRETFEAKLETKLQEIFELSNNVQSKVSEINAKDEKIGQLEKKIETLGEWGGNGEQFGKKISLVGVL